MMGKIRAWLVAVMLLLVAATSAAAQDTTALRHYGAEVSVVPGRAIAADSYEKKWLKGRGSTAITAAVRYAAVPRDSDDFAADYGYPVWIAGLRYNLNHGVTMHREKDAAWGQLEPVDYVTHMGDILTAYGAFERPLLRRGRWQADYTLGFGVGYAFSKYNPRDAIDNELIGSRLLIYFGAGLHVTCHIAPQWGVRAGMDFYHHSNGAMNRPNKGANVIGPSVSLLYEPYARELATAPHRRRDRPFGRQWTAEVAVGVGMKTLNEDWQLTQFRTAPGAPGYRTDHFRRYLTYSLQTNLMCRYARRWASGIGVDVFYGTYADRVAEIDRQQGIDARHSPWSVGVAARHRAYYHRLSLDMSLGVYLFRHMGDNARQVEAPYYERIGVHYTFPGRHGLSVGLDVKAHKTKADYTEITLAYPVKL